jgi:hypothetical protein
MSDLPPSPTNEPPEDSDFGALEKPADRSEDDRQAAKEFMEKVGSMIVRARPGKVDKNTERSIREAAQGDAAKAPIFLAAVMRREIEKTIRLFDAMDEVFDKLQDQVAGMDVDELGQHYDRLCREEGRRIESIMKLKGVIEGIDWNIVEAVLRGDSRADNAKAMTSGDRAALRKVFTSALKVAGEEPADDKDPVLDSEPLDVEFEVKGE